MRTKKQLSALLGHDLTRSQRRVVNVLEAVRAADPLDGITVQGIRSEVGCGRGAAELALSLLEGGGLIRLTHSGGVRWVARPPSPPEVRLSADTIAVLRLLESEVSA